MIPKHQKTKIIRFIKKVRFFGFKFKCPICKSYLKKLDPFGENFSVLTEKNVVGGGYRLNAQCPVCYSIDRERLLYLYLSKRTRFFNEKLKVLHIAPENGLSQIIKSHSQIDYLTTDISMNNVMEKMDITEIHYPADTFDVIICNHVLEHIVDDEKAMRELHRVLKTSGWGILQVPISLSLEKTYENFSVINPSEREIFFGQSDHVRIYAMDYFDRLKKSGFEIDRFNWQEDREFCCDNNKYGLLPSENIFIVRKTQAECKV